MKLLVFALIVTHFMLFVAMKKLCYFDPIDPDPCKMKEHFWRDIDYAVTIIITGCCLIGAFLC